MATIASTRRRSDPAAGTAPAPAHRRPLGKRLVRLALPAYTALAVVYLFVPIVVMIAFGFNDPKGRFNITWQGFTLANYPRAFQRTELTDAVGNSLVVAFVATTIATTLGTLMALAMTRHAFRGRRAVDLLIFLPIAAPEIVLGASLLSMFVAAGIQRDLTTIVIAHVMFNISYVVVTVRARISGLDSSLEEAAMDLGADELTTFRKVTFPLILPGIMAAALLAFALSVDDFVITLFAAGQSVTFPLWVYGASRIGVPPEVNVMGTLIFVIAAIGIVGWMWLQRRPGSAPAEGAPA